MKNTLTIFDDALIKWLDHFWDLNRPEALWEPLRGRVGRRAKEGGRVKKGGKRGREGPEKP